MSYEGGYKCPRCGSMEVSTGKWDGYAVLHEEGRVFSNGSKVLVQVCCDCGNMFDFRVAKPEKFRRKRRDDED